MASTEFDFIIVGGGLSGLVLATRLTEDPDIKVLVIEAGNDLTSDPRVNVPAMWPQLQGTTSDWSFKTVPQKGMGGRMLEVPQGRMLGGSAALNGLNFVVSSKDNIDAWGADLGNGPGWNWEGLSKAFRKAYSLTTSGNIEKEGPVQVTIPEEDTKWPQVWRETFAGLEYDPTGNDDPFSGKNLGAVMRTRSFAGNAYFAQARSRSNLTLWTTTVVEKLVLEPSSTRVTATGVQYTKDSSETKTVNAGREVILTAGTFGSPKLLELSGIGEADLLKSLNIEPVIDNPHVGENLQNHPVCVLSFETDPANEEGFETLDKLTRQDPATLAAAMDAYSQKQRGPLSKTNCNAMAHVPLPGISTEEGKADLARLLNSTSTAAEKGKTPSAFAKKHEAFVHSILTNPRKASDGPDGRFAPPPSVSGDSGGHFTIGVMLSHPLSRGSCHLANTRGELAIDPNHLGHSLDVEILARHVQFLESVLVKSEPLASHIKTKRCAPRPEMGISDANEAKRFVRETAIGASHYTGTCSMMPRELGGVVDPALRVYGCGNLRVCDASIIPLMPRGNPMATVYGVAERAAEIIIAGL
ncbi:hypothetical protein B0H66DRAFT_585005 [Apodospora peruviana]|uniref:Glucose-methanol-choline oxidoreductase N-terminal domain-containing protein n=1 Tax=Apodospora peruviana TaxID=516989 RepID=A0AAE0HT90_9PEZI|nr:hypothetical protein B0H66DRAFT_585005 [Apodospora peruviana]